jgi:FAD:protein FMN transferase
MKRSSLFLLLIAFTCVVSLSSCAKPQVTEHQLLVFGTIVNISIYGASAEQQREAITAISSDFQRMHHEWHAWEPGPLVTLNQNIAANMPAPIPSSLQPLMPVAIDMARLSDGLFNPAMGSLLKIWGFQQSERPNGPPPSKQQISAWLKDAPTMTQITINGSQIVSSNPNVQFDLGGIAKGYAIDLAIEKLKAFGIEHAIVNAGGDLRAIGSKDGQPWVVGIRHPQGKGVLASVQVKGDESVFTSGNYERYNEYRGVRYTHILDPRTGIPVEGVTSVTVIHPDGTIADAAATALVVAGAKDWHRIARQMGIKLAMLVEESGTVHLNPNMMQRLQLDPESIAKIRLSPPL